MPARTIPKPPVWVEEDDTPPDIIEPAVTGAVVGELVDDELDQPIMAMTVTQPTSNSVIVGIGALASLSDEEYEAKKAVLAKGIARVKDIQQSLMVDKEDYGKVPGIAKPFLQLPGAEKLALFYGFAVRQEAKRIVRQAGESDDVPVLSFQSEAFVHLGSFDGPIIAQGVGEANSHEVKYRYTFAKQACPNCGREGLIRGKKDGPLQGRLWCPGREGGCNRKFDPGDVPQAGKIENPDPHGLAETLLQIANKRAFVAAIRRATGTSGLFSQDDDSPSVQQQSASSGAPDPDAGEPVVTAAPVGIAVGVGARSEGATQLQRKRLAEVAKAKGLNGAKIAELMNRLFGMEVEPNGAAASAAALALNGQQIGQLLQTMETGDISSAPDIIIEADGQVI